MDFQAAFNAILSVATAVAIWLFNQLWNAIKDLQDRHQQLVESDKQLADKVGQIEVLVAGKYMTRDEFREDMKGIRDLLHEINGKLDGKVDKK